MKHLFLRQLWRSIDNTSKRLIVTTFQDRSRKLVMISTIQKIKKKKKKKKKKNKKKKIKKKQKNI